MPRSGAGAYPRLLLHLHPAEARGERQNRHRGTPYRPPPEYDLASREGGMAESSQPRPGMQWIFAQDREDLVRTDPQRGEPDRRRRQQDRHHDHQHADVPQVTQHVVVLRGGALGEAGGAGDREAGAPSNDVRV